MGALGTDSSVEICGNSHKDLMYLALFGLIFLLSADLIHQSFHLLLFQGRVTGQQPKQRSPDLLPLRHFLRLIQGSTDIIKLQNLIIIRITISRCH